MLFTAEVVIVASAPITNHALVYLTKGDLTTVLQAADESLGGTSTNVRITMHLSTVLQAGESVAIVNQLDPLTGNGINNTTAWY